MILKCKEPLDVVCENFAWIEPSLLEHYRDATYSTPDFELSLSDCWAGLAKGISQGWFQHSPDPEEPWGMYDMDEYIHYDSPLNGDMHEIVPGKFIAFVGPVDLGGCAYQDDENGWRQFSPRYYREIFNDFLVKHVLRLNESAYSASDFEQHGFEYLSLEFEDCTAPPPHVVEAFFSLVERSEGAIAVHCKAGLGRTGTLIGLYLMRYCGFTAREAIGWLRIVRPGSVIGEQQHFLCAVEAGETSGTTTLCRNPTADEAAARSAAQLVVGMQQRGSSRALLALATIEEEDTDTTPSTPAGRGDGPKHG